MIDHDNYIVCGDRIIATPRSATGESIQGRVLQVTGSEVGNREFILEVEGTNSLSDGAIGLPENRYLFEVERGDAWVSVPPFLLPDEAKAKAQRSVVNARKRIIRKVPLYADQIRAEKPDAERMVSRVAEDRRERLEKEHELARRATELRAQVASMISEGQLAILEVARSRFPRNASYGIYFWEKQLGHIQHIGTPDIYVPEPPVNCRCGIEWLRVDGEACWLSPKGLKKVRVLYVGTSAVLVKLVGQPIKDFDLREFPYGNCWVEPYTLQRSAN